MKKILALTLAALLCLSLAACSGKANGPRQPTDDTRPVLRVHAIAGPTGVGMVNLMMDNNNNNHDRLSVKYEFTVATAPDQVVAKIVSGEADIAAVPTNLAATLYNKTNGGVKVLALNTLGVLYVMQNGETTIKSIADLRGKTIYSTGEGANPEYILRYLLTKNGLDPDKDVTIKFLAENQELAAAVIKGDAEVALVPEPLVTNIQSKTQKPQVVLSCTEEWNKVADNNSRLTMGCVVVRNEVLQQNPQAVADFMKHYQTSIERTKTAVTTTAELCDRFGIISPAVVAVTAIPRCNVTYIAGAEMKTALSGFLKVLFDANPKAVGGALPNDDFYYGA